ncbi:MAG: sugar ABC transporter ATP-binding protein [Devosia sp.]
MPALTVSGLTKQYGGVRALVGASLEVKRGSVHAVVGENGAGKSTLMKIIAGAITPDAGTLALDGKPVSFAGPLDAGRAGVGIVYQELSTFPTRDVLANLFANREPTRFGFVSRQKMMAEATPVLEQLGLAIKFDDRAGDLPVADRQLLEIARALLAHPRLILLDEPNSALNQRETARLFAIIRKLCETGVTVLYVSHRLEEVFEIADTVSVMRNGELVWTRPRQDLSIPEVIDAMLGQRAEDQYPAEVPRRSFGTPPLRVVDMSFQHDGQLFSFDVAPGEILGVAGLDGSGGDKLLPMLFGARGKASGLSIYPDGSGPPASPHAAALRGIALVPADRRREGLMLQKSIATNTAHVALGARARWWEAVTTSVLTSRARRVISDLGVKAQSERTIVHHLSGGNQQKIVVGKWLETNPGLILLDDPTRGIDVGAKRELFLLVRRLQLEGKIVLMRSTELGELLGMCSRVLVFYRQGLAGIAECGKLDQRSLLEAINTGKSVAF